MTTTVTPWAWTTIVHAKLWRDEGMREAFITHTTRQDTPGYVRVDDERRVAPSFGQLVHAADCARTPHSVPTQTVGECSDECTIAPCDEADATVVLIRVEVNVRKVDEDA